MLIVMMAHIKNRDQNNENNKNHGLKKKEHKRHPKPGS